MISEILYEATVNLTEALDFQPEARILLEQYLTPEFFEQNIMCCRALTDPHTAEAAQKQMESILADIDPDGFMQLTVYLGAAALVREKYLNAGISDDIYFNTMDAFPRFVKETYENEGRLCFDRGFWTWRQTSGRLFRIGCLEFEYRCISEDEPLTEGLAAGAPVLSVHIPSGQPLVHSHLQAAYHLAENFFKNKSRKSICTDGAPQAIVCDSWLLTPVLTRFLAPDSGIRRFAADYTVYAEFPQDESFYQWLFGKKAAPDKLPQKTSLQREVSAYLAEGGKVGYASGLLCTL